MQETTYRRGYSWSIGESVNRRDIAEALEFYYLRKQQTLPKNKFDILSSYAIIWDNAICYQSLSYILNSTTNNIGDVEKLTEVALVLSPVSSTPSMSSYPDYIPTNTLPANY